MRIKRMSENRGFWSRLASPFRRAAKPQNRRLSHDENFRLSHDGSFQFPYAASSHYDFRRYRTKVVGMHSAPDLYVPKCLGSVDASSILFGGTRPEGLSQGCWLENVLDRFGNLGGLENTTYSLHSETDSDFVYRPNDQSHETISDEYDRFDPNFNDSHNDSDIFGDFNTRYDDDSIFGGRTDYNFMHRPNDLINDTLSDDDAGTLRGSIGSVESTVSEVLAMLDDTILRHSNEARSESQFHGSTPQPPPYSSICNSSIDNTPASLPPPPPTPLEPPPSYSDLFGLESDLQMGVW